MDENIKTPDMATLEGWFSAPRMARYADARDPAALYVWDARLSKALLEDISHVEVLLRNFMVACSPPTASGRPATGAFDRPGR